MLRPGTVLPTSNWNELLILWLSRLAGSSYLQKAISSGEDPPPTAFPPDVTGIPLGPALPDRLLHLMGTYTKALPCYTAGAKSL